ncbi:pentapeptide repeat-containing protein [Arsenophonus endosymbiont of Aleurodicus floccissimus]|uniref:pentapeptide repeat-containing protein n=1 Tax=Arsenophonus endosymbiont of Aleurodicus floccissimus TaxID=2152761 RepID=UPI001EDF61F8|nr:pentapeptide repeat-containing protein [Arsenophonus endosymbiont of Aleurodicus floccissimus]
MAYINMDTNRCSMFTNYAININPIEGKELATSPKGLLEHIINFFTLGGVERKLSKQYDNFMQTITTALEEKIANSNCYHIPKELKFNFDGCSVAIKPSEYHSDKLSVTVERQTGENCTSDIDVKGFKNTTILMLLNNRIDPNIFIKEGKIHLLNTDLSARILEGIDLSEAYFSNVNLNGTDLSGANLQNTNIINATFYNAKLIETNLNDAKIEKTTFKYAKLNSALLERASIAGANFDHVTLICANLTDTKIITLKLANGEIKTNTFNHATLDSALLVKTTIAGTRNID